MSAGSQTWAWCAVEGCNNAAGCTVDGEWRCEKHSLLAPQQEPPTVGSVVEQEFEELLRAFQDADIEFWKASDATSPDWPKRRREYIAARSRVTEYVEGMRAERDEAQKQLAIHDNWPCPDCEDKDVTIASLREDALTPLQAREIVTMAAHFPKFRSAFTGETFATIERIASRLTAGSPEQEKPNG